MEYLLCVDIAKYSTCIVHLILSSRALGSGRSGDWANSPSHKGGSNVDGRQGTVGISHLGLVAIGIDVRGSPTLWVEQENPGCNDT